MSRRYTLHTPSLGLPRPCPPMIPRRLSTIFSLGMSLRAKIPGSAPFNPTQSLVLHPCGSTLECDPEMGYRCALPCGGGGGVVVCMAIPELMHAGHRSCTLPPPTHGRVWGGTVGGSGCRRRDLAWTVHIQNSQHGLIT